VLERESKKKRQRERKGKGGRHVVVDVLINSEHSSKNVLDVVHEVFGERNVVSVGENFGIIQLVLNPTRQSFNRFRGGNLYGLFDFNSVSPVIFVSDFV
jgi:hypothetical protein